MPTITNATLTLTETTTQLVTVKVTYDANFTRVERQLFGLGLSYHSHVTVHGVDGSTVGGTPAQHRLSARLHRRSRWADCRHDGSNAPRSWRSTRSAAALLQEDPFGDPDELKCNIRIHSPLPSAVQR